MAYRQLLPAALLALLTGCGPMVIPAVRRLAADEQAAVNRSWDNMLTPQDRLDRQTLLDAVVTLQLIHTGVDRLSLRSEKAIAGGSVVMTVRFDRADPGGDYFGVDVFDREGRRVRSERYAHDEVFDACAALWAATPQTRPTTGSTTEPAELPNPRLARVLAATRPATVPPVPTTDR